ncbi:hypothetical protein C3L33_10131, partial [Rhododendron williamsianum]
MEVTASSILLSLALATFLTCAWKAVNWVWLRPKQLERCLRDQGFKGNTYRFLYGDSKDFVPAIIAARSKPMEVNDDDIVPRVLPIHQYFVNLHGMYFPFQLQPKKIHKVSFLLSRLLGWLAMVTIFGTNYLAWMGPTPRVNITDPKLIKEIFSNTEVFQKPVMNPLRKFIVTGIATYNGEKWATHRSLVNPAFHLEKLKLMVPAMYSSCCEMIGKWEVLVSTKRSSFGSDYEEGKQLFQLQKEQADILMQLLRSIYIPGWRFSHFYKSSYAQDLLAYRFLPTKTNRKMRKIYNEVGALVQNIINKRQRTMNGEGDTDLLGILLKSNLKATDQELGSKNNKLTVEDIIEECKLFYFAGQETTSVLLVWTMVLLSKHQKWQALAREEVLAVFGDNKPDGITNQILMGYISSKL